MDTFTKEPPKLLGTIGSSPGTGNRAPGSRSACRTSRGVVDDLAFIKTVGDRRLQPRAGEAVREHGLDAVRPAEHGGLGHLWDRQRIVEPAGVRGVAVGPARPRGGAVNWWSGFLPSAYQGVPLRSGGDPILNLATPQGISGDRQRRTIETIEALNRTHLDITEDPEIATRINAYEVAYRMQTSAPELIDLSSETPETLKLYGVEPGKPGFATNCLLARRLVERGVRFVQLYHTDWDHHGGPGQTLNRDLEQVCREIDQPCAALVRDLKARGLLDDTLVVWGGEFGRTPMGEIRESVGRNHHIDAMTIWMAGGGVEAGHHPGRDRRVRLRPGRRPRARPRHPGHHPAPARPGPHAIDVPVPGPRLPSDRRGRAGRGGDPRLRRASGS